MLTNSELDGIVTLKNVYVTTTGFIFDENFKPIFLSACNDLASAERLSELKGFDYLSFDKSKKITELQGEYIFFMTLHRVHVWGHIREGLSRLYHFQDEKFKNCKLLMNPGHFRSWPNLTAEQSIKKHLSFFGFNSSRQFQTLAYDWAAYKVETLHLARSMHLTVEGLGFIKETWLNAINIPERKCEKNKIYLSRQAAKQRAVLNNKEIEDYLRSQGFYIWTGAESFEEQVHIFRDAEIIIGPHGAAFFNCIFCEKQPIVLECVPSTRAIAMWSAQSHILGNKNHRLIECHSDQSYGHSIPLEMIKNYL